MVSNFGWNKFAHREANSYLSELAPIEKEEKKRETWELFPTMAQMAHFSFPYYFTIPNSELRIPNFALRISEFGIRNCEVYVVWASGNS